MRSIFHWKKNPIFLWFLCELCIWMCKRICYGQYCKMVLKFVVNERMALNTILIDLGKTSFLPQPRSLAITFFSPINNKNVTTNDVLTLLPHFLTLWATKMWQQNYNSHLGKIKMHFVYIYSVYQEENKWKHQKYILICSNLL